MSRHIVTLTTNWGDSDFFAGKVKGMLYGSIDDVHVVDIAHHVATYDIIAQSFIIRNALTGFPPGTVHIIDLSANVSSEHPYIAIENKGQFFLMADDGLPSLLFPPESRTVVALPMQENVFQNFAALTSLTRAAIALCQGTPFNQLGVTHTQLVNRMLSNYVQVGENYRIFIQYIDTYGNCYLGMTYREFEQLRNGRKFRLTLFNQTVDQISLGYYSASTNNALRHRICLTVSATGVLELAIREHSLAESMNLHIDDSVILTFI
ncbi:MAG: SAM-dependent chlorinase/fluorinase [Bacteroidales bacterium]|nr:SAM-dependent chlorinase/fluorinase [Bacteroidales bacterium]MBR1799830.1 SAM-dependent chlorinase/fluorinase [Bacteroidales bacterium]